jgi:large subunit ribosomal protein L17
MRHQRAGKKLGRDSAHRKALYSNLAGALIEHGRIKTTVTKAKAVKPFAEQMITLGRRGDLHARRQATAFLRSRDVVHHLFAEVAPRFKDRPGGYTRIVKLGPRQGDSAEMAYLELVDDEYVAQLREERQTAVPDLPGEADEEAPETEDEVVEDPEAAEEELAAEPEAEKPAEES